MYWLIISIICLILEAESGFGMKIVPQNETFVSSFLREILNNEGEDIKGVLKKMDGEVVLHVGLTSGVLNTSLETGIFNTSLQRVPTNASSLIHQNGIYTIPAYGLYNGEGSMYLSKRSVAGLMNPDGDSKLDTGMDNIEDGDAINENKQGEDGDE